MNIPGICAKLSELESRIFETQNSANFDIKSEEFIAELKSEILNFLRENKNDHYQMEDYFEYNINLRNALQK